MELHRNAHATQTGPAFRATAPPAPCPSCHGWRAALPTLLGVAGAGFGNVLAYVVHHVRLCRREILQRVLAAVLQQMRCGPSLSDLLGMATCDGNFYLGRIFCWYDYFQRA